jgi:hypothetical protein
VASASPAQSALTNDSIIKMVKAGLGEDVIVSMVNSQTARYNLAPDDLIALKSAGVPDRIVTAMVKKYSAPGFSVSTMLGGKPSGATTQAGTVSAGDPNDPMAPHDSGIYLYAKNPQGGHTLAILEQAAYQGSQTGGVMSYALTYGLKKMKTKAVIPGPHSGFVLSDPEPVFYFYFDEKATGLGGSMLGSRVANPNQFALIKLDVTKSSRETIIGELGTLGTSSGTHQKSMVGFKSERLKPGLYKVTPDGPMKPGHSQACGHRVKF